MLAIDMENSWKMKEKKIMVKQMLQQDGYMNYQTSDPMKKRPVTPPQKPPEGTKVKVILRDFAESTTAHGIGRVATSNVIWLKIFWALMFLVAFAVFAWQSVFLLQRFLMNPVTVETKVVYEEVKFPAVSICNLNRIRRSQLDLGGESFVEAVDEMTAAVLNQFEGGGAKKKRKKRSTHCTTNPCENGGTCAEDASKPRGYNCTCASGFWGEKCEVACVNEPYFPSGDTAGLCFTVENVNTTFGACTTGNNAILDTADKATHIKNNLAVPSTYWIDLHQDASDANVYRWNDDTTGDVVTDASWETAYPDGNDANNCVLVDHETHKWMNEACTAQAIKVCMADVTRDIYSDPATTMDPATLRQTEEELSETTWDQSDEYYTPTVDLTDKPWFQEQEKPDVTISNAKNLSRLMTDIPLHVRRSMGHRVDTMLQECTWEGRQCTPLNFTGFLSRSFGNCYTFNSGEIQDILKAKKPGSLYGLVMTVFIEQHEYVEAFSPSAGLRVLVHRQDQQPFPEDDGFDVTPGHKTSVTIRLRKYNKLPKPFSNCTDGKDVKLMYTKSYSPGACRRSCLQQAKLDACSCADSLLPVPPDAIVCSTDKALKCSDDTETEVQTGKILCSCPELCKDESFVTSVATSEWPGEAFETTVRAQFSKRGDDIVALLNATDGVRKNFLKLEVFYEEIKYEDVGENPAYGVENLLADIGGQLGLWIGVSVLTIVEVIQLVVELLQTLCVKKENKKKVDPAMPTGYK